MGKKINPFAQFSVPEVFTKQIESLNYEISYRKLTAAEEDNFNVRMVEGVDRSKKEEVNLKEAVKIKYEKMAMQLIDPKTTVGELQKLPSSVISEVYSAITEDDMIDEKGNLES